MGISADFFIHTAGQSMAEHATHKQLVHCDLLGCGHHLVLLPHAMSMSISANFLLTLRGKQWQCVRECQHCRPHDTVQPAAGWSTADLSPQQLVGVGA